jgi:hypothetical protein
MRNLPVNIDRLIDAALNHLHHRLPNLDLLALCNFRWVFLNLCGCFGGQPDRGGSLVLTAMLVR